ncbi:MAG: hypothetical protein EPN38_07510 [Rhodanobacteraceae bacterium]|nr:MAG: hypothetical protein EPN38_07510 [Rhodanobacteraceae bacterium]
MRIASILVGIVLLALGIWVAFGNVTYPSTETPFRLGQIEVKTTIDKPVPAALGYAGIAIGGVLLLVGALKKR